MYQTNKFRSLFVSVPVPQLVVPGVPVPQVPQLRVPTVPGISVPTL